MRDACPQIFESASWPASPPPPSAPLTPGVRCRGAWRGPRTRAVAAGASSERRRAIRPASRRARRSLVRPSTRSRRALSAVAQDAYACGSGGFRGLPTAARPLRPLDHGATLFLAPEGESLPAQTPSREQRGAGDHNTTGSPASRVLASRDDLQTFSRRSREVARGDVVSLQWHPSGHRAKRLGSSGLSGELSSSSTKEEPD